MYDLFIGDIEIDGQTLIGLEIEFDIIWDFENGRAYYDSFELLGATYGLDPEVAPTIMLKKLQQSKEIEKEIIRFVEFMNEVV